MVQNVGLEPTRPNEHSDLNAACLPFQQFCINGHWFSFRVEGYPVTANTLAASAFCTMGT